jgi:hypothetical protein
MRRARTGLRLLLVLATTLCVGATARAATPEIAEVPFAPPWDAVLTPGPDGAVWGLSERYRPGTDVTDHVIDRIGPDGALSHMLLPSLRADGTQTQLRSPLTALADGGMGMIVAHTERTLTGVERVPDVTLTHIGAGAAFSEAFSLPQPARRAHSFAIAADGSVWFGRACRDELYRVSPEGRLVRMRLPRLGCTGDDAERTSAIAVAPDGAVWLANVAQHRIVRRDLDGRLRTWDLVQDSCEAVELDEGPAPLTLLLDGRGGLLYEAVGCAGRIAASGRPDMGFDYDGTGFVDDEGVWWNGAGATRLDGWHRASPLPSGARASDVVQAHDGAAWFVGGFHHYEGYKSTEHIWWNEPQVATFVGDEPQRWSLMNVVPSSSGEYRLDAGQGTLGPDGAIWTIVRSSDRPALVRIVPPGTRAPRAPVATVTRVLRRDGRTLWLQLACDAERGRFCRGRVTLARRSFVAAPARFAIAGTTRAAIPLTLSRDATDALRRGGRRAVPVTAVVRNVGASATRKRVTLRP